VVLEMTSLLDHLTGCDDTEDAPMTIPRQGFRAASAVPWWAGVYGLDPAIPVDDWALAAQCTAMACAARVFGTGAGYREKLLSGKGAPARQWTGWLLAESGPEDALRRRLALRLICDQAPEPDADGILTDAQRLHESCSPGRR
jgi:hypothetical protein